MKNNNYLVVVLLIGLIGFSFLVYLFSKKENNLDDSYRELLDYSKDAELPESSQYLKHKFVDYLFQFKENLEEEKGFEIFQIDTSLSEKIIITRTVKDSLKAKDPFNRAFYYDSDGNKSKVKKFVLPVEVISGKQMVNIDNELLFNIVDSAEGRE